MINKNNSKISASDINYPSVNHRPIFFLFLFKILVRLPILIFWNPYNNKNEKLNTYKIDYVLYCDGFSRYLNWNEYTIKTDIFGDLELVKISDYDDRVMLYKVR